MIVVVVLLILLQCASIWFIVKVVKKNLELSDQREELIDQIEKSLDILDHSYANIAHAAEIPVLSDEPVIRDVLSHIKHARNAVLAVAGLIVIYDENNSTVDD